MSEFPHIPYRRSPIAREEAKQIAEAELELARQRRSVRFFADTPVPRELIEAALEIACTAPSGANKQPWRFVVISDPEIKHRIRLAAEEEEREFYVHRATPEWLEALAPIGTDPNKPFLDIAPYLIVVFRINYEIADERQFKNYYVPESVGIAVGMLLSALNHFGLVTLTHTPAPMTFLNEICGRPPNEKPFVLLPVGYPALNCTVPDLPRKPFHEMVVWKD
jgi:iodotyrosine deiodinase